MSKNTDTRIAELADTPHGDFIGAIHNYLLECSEEEFQDLQKDFMGRMRQDFDRRISKTRQAAQAAEPATHYIGETDELDPEAILETIRRQINAGHAATYDHVSQLIDSGKQADIAFHAEMLFEYFAEGQGHDDGFMPTAAWSVMPLDPSMLKRREAA